MREIKFRAWHKAEKKMYRVVTLYLGAHEQSVVLIDGSVFKSPLMHCSLEEIELLQYTGLLDKDEREIYEGDIVQLAAKIQMPFAINELTWLHGSEWEESRYGYDFQGWTNEKVEIIGNIYENPDMKISL